MQKGQSIKEVVQKLKANGFSQMPVLDADNKPAGMIHEVDLLHALMDGRATASDSIDANVAPLQGVVAPETPIAKLAEVFAEDNVAVVREGSRLLGIVTKIDYIEFLEQRVR